jgi:hypothetical protein
VSEAHLRAMPAVRRGPSEAHARGRGAGRPERKVTLPRAGPREVGIGCCLYMVGCSALPVVFHCVCLFPQAPLVFSFRKEKRNYIRKKDLHIIRYYNARDF